MVRVVCVRRQSSPSLTMFYVTETKHSHFPLGLRVTNVHCLNGSPPFYDQGRRPGTRNTRVRYVTITGDYLPMGPGSISGQCQGTRATEMLRGNGAPLAGLEWLLPRSRSMALGMELNLRNLPAVTTLTLLLAVSSFAQSPGETLFTQNCVACHGTDLSGRTTFGKKANIPDLRTAVVQNRSDGDLFSAIGRGEGHKEYPHAFLSRGLTQVQVKNIIAYIRSMSTVSKK